MVRRLAPVAMDSLRPGRADLLALNANLRLHTEKPVRHEVRPHVSEGTKAYLKRLDYGLSSVDPVVRVAHMERLKSMQEVYPSAVGSLGSCLHQRRRLAAECRSAPGVAGPW